MAPEETVCPDLTDYVTGLRARAEALRHSEATRRLELRAALPEVVKLLVREFGVTRVVLFGSLARHEAGLQSDVDLLVDGLAPERLFDAMAGAARVLRAEVDLVRRESGRPEIVRRAEVEGEVLHG